MGSLSRQDARHLGTRLGCLLATVPGAWFGGWLLSQASEQRVEQGADAPLTSSLAVLLYVLYGLVLLLVTAYGLTLLWELLGRATRDEESRRWRSVTSGTYGQTASTGV